MRRAPTKVFCVMIRVWIFVLLLVGSKVAVALEPSEAAKTLRWKFAVGQKFRVATQSDMTRTTKIKANVDETKIKTIIDLIWEVKAVDAMGVATIEQRPERLAITLDHRHDQKSEQKYELDSELLKKNPNLKGPDREALKVLLEGSATIKLDARGVVLESSVPPDWSEKLRETSLADMHDQLVLAATPQILPGVQLNLPEGAIEDGNEWLVEAPKEEAAPKDENKPKPPSGSAKFIYRGEKPLEGEPRDLIDIELTIAGLPEGITVTSQANRGKFWFDSEAGQAVSLQLTQSWKAEKTFRDNVILLTTNGTSTTSWTLLP